MVAALENMALQLNQALEPLQTDQRLTLNIMMGTLYPAPGKAVTMYANTKAACQSITE
jgi:hypothetical protein